MADKVGYIPKRKRVDFLQGGGVRIDITYESELLPPKEYERWPEPKWDNGIKAPEWESRFKKPRWNASD